MKVRAWKKKKSVAASIIRSYYTNPLEQIVKNVQLLNYKPMCTYNKWSNEVYKHLSANKYL